MKKLMIVKEEKDNYILKDKEENQYPFTLEFHDIEKRPSLNDNIYISENLLDKNNEQYNSYYVFGSLDNTYGRKIINEKDDDIIIIETQNKEKKLLKRLYG